MIRIDYIDPTKFKNVKVMDAGFVRVPVFTTRVGVFTYQRPNGRIVRELRHPSEVFNKDSLESMRGIPLTSRHPQVSVNTENVKKLGVGFVSDRMPTKDGIFVSTHATIQDQLAIDEVVKDGIQEVSCGYDCDVIEESGIYVHEDGTSEEYDAIQKNIRYNHLAIVPKGRAGSNVKFRLDSEDAILVTDANKEKTMKIKIGDQTFEVSDEAGKAITSALDKKDKTISDMKEKMKDTKSDHENELKEAKSREDKLQAKCDSLDSDKKELSKKLDESQKTKRIDAKELNTLVKERKNVQDVAEKILGKEFKTDELENIDIKKEVVKKLSPDLKIDEKSEEYINARFDHIAENADLHQDHLKKAVEDSKKDGDDKPKSLEEIRKDNMDKAREAHRAPLSMSKNNN